MKIPEGVLLSGDVADSILVLTRPDIRSAEELTQASLFHTADGDVMGRPGDVGIMAYGGERYPIKREVFLGTYKVLGKVGHYLAAERLIHVRRAWPVVSAQAVFNYGDDRGTVPVARGGWVYQSDDGDYGVINSDVKHKGHLEIGAEEQVRAANWSARYDRWTLLLASLPPELSLLALLAFAATAHHLEDCVSNALIGAETALLVVGAAVVWWIREDRWLLRASIASGQALCARFQDAATLLGDAASTDFPNMALWRCAQAQELGAAQAKAASGAPTHDAKPQLEARLKNEIGSTLEEFKTSIERYHERERYTE